MLKIRHVFIMLGMLLYPLASPAQVSVSIGINLPVYPNLVVIPGYPVYYAPQLNANFFFYDGMYWVYQDDDWYTSSWYNGPWWPVDPVDVPVFILRIPIYYYRQPPAYFIGWRSDAPPRWGDHWGREWEQRRSGWDRWNRNVTPAPAPLPVYQRQYSRDRYPEQVQQQQRLQQQHYRFHPRDPVVRQYEQAVPSVQQANPQQRRTFEEKSPSQQGLQHPGLLQQVAPEERGSRQQSIQRPHQLNTPVVPRPEQQIQRQTAPRQDHAQPPTPVQREHPRGQENRQQGKEAPNEPRQERGRDRND